VLYGLEEQIWTVPAGGGGRPVAYATRGDSPTVVRW
jgi:hypothetical protein